MDDALSRLAEQNRANDRPAMKETMQQLVRTLSAREHRWLARIILSEVRQREIGGGGTGVRQGLEACGSVVVG